MLKELTRETGPADRTAVGLHRPAAEPGHGANGATGTTGTTWYGQGGRIPAPRPPRDGSPARPVTVALLADDPVTGQGAAALLGLRKDVTVLAADRRHEAQVVLILVNRVTEETLGWIEGAAEAAVGDVGFVLVGDGIRERQVLRAVTHGLVSVIPRQEADFERILGAVRAVRDGRLEMPAVAVGWLADQLRRIQRDILEPRQLTAAGLEAREVEVLRMLSEGLGTAQIALDLHYSERTVKNIIHGVLTRLNLRNRTEAVAYALRAGVL